MIKLNTDLDENLKNILNVLSDGIYISDNLGYTLWVNDASEKILNISREKLIGKNVYDLEKEGFMRPSVTRMVLENKSTINTVQTMNNNRKHLVTGHMINSSGRELVIVHSRDITESMKTSLQLEETENLLRHYSNEVRNFKLKQEKETSPPKKYIGNSTSSKEMLDLVDKISSVNTTVLITGETGVGKNAIAERIHQLSDRNEKSFIHINCGAIPESLIESELFGYKKGAFTGATNTGKVGLVKIADKGTLFLDEISELPLHLQPKLLQLLQNKSYLPVGETKLQEVNIRIIAASNQDLYKMAQQGTFRTDLYYRLNILPIQVPPLRERQEDIFPLLIHFLNKFNRLHNKSRTFSTDLIDLLQVYEWPGNIRELENLVERLVITSKNNEICFNDLPEKIKEKNKEKDTHYLKEHETLTEALERIEKEIIINFYRKHKTTRKAASSLGVSQSLFMRRIKKYALDNEVQGGG